MFLFNRKRKRMIADKINDPNATIVDVRTVGEFQSGHLNGSINIPLDEVEARIEELKAMSRPLILCCRSGARSGNATAFLSAQGFEEVYNGGGWTDVRLHKID